MADSLSLYLHIPFCRHRCAYCDFNTYAGMSEFIPDYVDTLCEEIRLVAASAQGKLPAHTIFFGGGTPSLLPVNSVEKILGVCNQNFDISPDAEITLEANPGTVALDWLTQVSQLGVNRISFGMQSAQPGELRMLEREHDPIDVIRVVERARLADIQNVSLDLIFGLPSQSLESWSQSIDFALRLLPEHLSLYCLTIEAGTQFKRWVDRGLLPAPDDDLAADMYQFACQRLEAAGFVHYEISNWAKRYRDQVYTCRHNLQYWQMRPYLGFGAGAHGFAANFRTANVRGIRSYIQQIKTAAKVPFPAGPAVETLLPVDRWTEMQETMMIELRLLQSGVSASDFEQRFGIPLVEAFGKQIQRLTADGLLEWAGDSMEQLRLTQRGWLLGNRVFREFVGLPEPTI